MKNNCKTKYRNIPSKRTLQDGTIYEFSSIKEAKRYDELMLLLKSEKISNLQMQVPFVLIPAQYIEIIEYTPKTHKEKKVKKLVEQKLKYIADFVYEQNGEMVVEDVKGYRRAGAYSTFVIKRKLMLWIHGIRIVEV